MVELGKRNWARAVATAFALWLVAFICYITPDALTGDARLRNVEFLSICAASGILLSLSFFGALNWGRRLPKTLRFAWISLALVGSILIHATIDTLAFNFIFHPRFILGDGALASAGAILFVNNSLLLAPVHVTFAVVVLLAESRDAVRESQQRLEAALVAAKEAQLSALRFQINPHFLFNSFNAVSALIAAGRNAEAEAVVGRLAAFFRSSLQSEPMDIVPLSEEFDTLAAYLDIESVRLGDRLDVDLDLPRHLAGKLVPQFILQPLVENAVKHAVMPSADPVSVCVRASEARHDLVLEVTDDGRDGLPPQSGTGVGIANVRARLSALYGAEASLEAGRKEDGYSVRISLPLHRVDAGRTA